MIFAPREHYDIPAEATRMNGWATTLFLAGIADTAVPWKLANTSPIPQAGRGLDEHTLVGVPELAND